MSRLAHGRKIMCAGGDTDAGGSIVHSRIHQGQFGETFVRLLASAAGLTVAKPEPDVTGEDFTFGYAADDDDDPLAGAKIDAQVKSWRRSATVRHSDCWDYRMDRKHFNRLAGRRNIPRYLILVIVPDDWRDYTITAAHGLTAKYCAYWVSLADRGWVDPQLPGRVPVAVPMANVLGATTLLDLFSAGVDGQVGV
jgi:hypothetical protein